MHMPAHTAAYAFSVGRLQLAARRGRKLTQRHWGNIRRYYARMPDPTTAMDLALIKGRAA